MDLYKGDMNIHIEECMKVIDSIVSILQEEGVLPDTFGIYNYPYHYNAKNIY